MNVLFVCSGNAFRSPVAEALLKKLRPDLKVDSAGIYPGIPVSESAQRYLKREGAERYLKRTPEGLYSKNLGEFDVIIAMEGRHKEAVLRSSPEYEDKTVVWNIQDPYFMVSISSEKVFNQIKKKVEELANSLE